MQLLPQHIPNLAKMKQPANTNWGEEIGKFDELTEKRLNALTTLKD